MMKTKITAIVLSVSLFAGSLAMPLSVHAQAGVQDNGGVNVQPPGNQDGGINNAQPNNSSGQTGGTTTQNTGVDWRWLLPLLIIPLLFLIPRSSRDQEVTEYRSGRVAGSKGGQATRDEDTEVVDEDE